MNALATKSQAAHSPTLPRRIVVDLTPMLPGGENGGAKIFILELIKELARYAPTTQFVLLTREGMSQEIAQLDALNVTSILAPVPSASKRRARELFRRLESAVTNRLPHKGLQRLVRLTTEAAQRVLSIAPSLNEGPVDLLFCPFTAPTYHMKWVPTVSTIYDLQYITYPQFFSKEDVEQRHRSFQDACRHCSALAAISDYSRKAAIEHGTIDHARVRTIYIRTADRFGDAADLSPSPVLGGLGLETNGYILYPANFWRHKNHEVLIAAFGVARQRGLPKDLRLVCTGAPGSRRDYLKDLVDRFSLSEHVILAGYLADREMAVLIRNCCGVIFPSLYEGFGIPVIEAMRAGRPVACSSLTSLPEVAGDAALMFDPRIPEEIATAIVRLVTDEPLRKSLVAAGLARATDFADTAQMAREYWELFLYAIARSQASSILSGVHGDSWAGPRLSLHVPSGLSYEELELELFAPDWLPSDSVQVRTNQAYTPVVARVERGHRCAIRLDVPPVSEPLELTLEPCFVPAANNGGNDTRELSVIVERCSLVCADGERHQVFLEGAR